MRPIGWVGVILVVAGIVVVAMGGVPYTRSRSEMQVGPMKVAAEERGLVPPIAGIVAVVVGGILIFAERKRG